MVSVDATILRRLGGEFIPVIAPIALTAEGLTLNVNADPFAARLAVALEAEKLVLLTDVPGVRGQDQSLIATLDAAGARALIAEGTVTGGMDVVAKIAAAGANKQDANGVSKPTSFPFHALAGIRGLITAKLALNLD